MLNRNQFMLLHTVLAAFALPVACMFLITGALYTWGIKGSYDTETHEIQLKSPIKPEITELISLAESELEKLGVSTPSGKAKIKHAGNHFMLEWTGSKQDILIEPTDNAITAKLTVKHTSWYRNLVQLHKAKGGILFKVYSTIFALSLALLLISGFFMAWQIPKLKKLALTTALFGVISFVAMIILS